MQTQTTATTAPAKALLCKYSAEILLRKQELTRTVAMIDLGPIKFKLVHEDGIAPDRLVVMERLYRQHLVLTELFPDVTIVPTKFIDTMWHAHILDTPKYRTDCDAAFGHFVDHFPYLGLRGEDDAAALAAAFAETRNFYLEIFGTDLVGEASSCEGTECGGTACGKSNCGKLDFSVRPSLN